MRKLKQMVVDECANYTRDTGVTKDYCCLEKHTKNKCIYFLDSQGRCFYFEQSVLPSSREFQVVYYAQRMEGKLSKKSEQDIIDEFHAKDKSRKKCQRCGSIFPANSNRQLYCEKCKSVVARERARERVQKHRKGYM